MKKGIQFSNIPKIESPYAGRRAVISVVSNVPQHDTATEQLMKSSTADG